MSVGLSLILPNNCQDFYDNALALETFHRTIFRIKEYFGGREDFVEDIEIYNSDSPNWGEYCNPDEDPGVYRFELPIINATCHLKQGYWDIWLMAITLVTFGLIQKILMGAFAYGQEKMPSMLLECLASLRVGFVMSSIRGIRISKRIGLPASRDGVLMVETKKRPRCMSSTLVYLKDVWI